MNVIRYFLFISNKCRITDTALVLIGKQNVQIKKKTTNKTHKKTTTNTNWDYAAWYETRESKRPEIEMKMKTNLNTSEREHDEC
jgi:hypothetical protein